MSIDEYLGKLRRGLESAHRYHSYVQIEQFTGISNQLLSGFARGKGMQPHSRRKLEHWLREQRYLDDAAPAVDGNGADHALGASEAAAVYADDSRCGLLAQELYLQIKKLEAPESEERRLRRFGIWLLSAAEAWRELEEEQGGGHG